MGPLDNLNKELQEANGEKNKLLNNLFTHKFKGELPIDMFCKLLKVKADKLLFKKGILKEFVIDKNNHEIIRQLYLYFMGSKECKWNIHAGIIFAGKVGCGKTLLMTSYILLSNELINRQITTYHSKELVGVIQEKGIKEIVQRPLFIDELGREESEVKDFGTVLKPLIDLITQRYEIGARTYATTNYMIEALTNKYGEFIVSRLMEMCNYVVMPGESRRNSNIIK